jgi:hypothetical protein
MIKILNELEQKLGRLPYAYEVIEHAGMVPKTVMLKLNKIESYPKNLLISKREKELLDVWATNKNIKEVAVLIDSTPQYVSSMLIKLNDKGVIQYDKIVYKREEKFTPLQLNNLKPLKPLPTRRMWRNDPASGMIGGIL